MFFDYHQNNSGGSFIPPAINVIIEADSIEEADRIAVEEAGIYFDGCSDGRDCSCCGDRWYSAEYSDGTEEPTIYGEPADKEPEFIDWSTETVPHCIIFYRDGSTKTIRTH